MKIKQLFKRAAAVVMAAVMVLCAFPATAFAATGDVGTITFNHTYDANGNAMRYNSGATINGYHAGGTGNYKYRMYVDGSTAFCIQPGVPLHTGDTLKESSSATWDALSASQKKAVGLALLYGYQGNRGNLSGSDDENWLATQTLVWEFVTGAASPPAPSPRRTPRFMPCTLAPTIPTAVRRRFMIRSSPCWRSITRCPAL